MLRMPQFDEREFAHLKKLSRIDVPKEEEQNIIDSLNRVFDYFSQLSEVNTDDVNPCNYVLRSMLKNQMRADIVGDVLSRDQFLANAPDQIGGMIRVPPVLKSAENS